ncbi:MAG: zinc ribbon domain-containing protein [Coriobacteriaceae bacterium]|nr:zinc ribbon domain-containing protein [Coriobacteriaceae bacterium]
MLDDLVPEPASGSLAGSDALETDEQNTSVLDGGELSGAQPTQSSEGSSRGAARKPMPAPAEPADGRDPYAKPRRGKWIAAGVALVLMGGGAWFVTADPLGVMPGLLASFDKAASEMYPSRQKPEGSADASSADDAEAKKDKGEQKADHDDLSDKTLSEAEAFQRLSAIYGRIVAFQDEIGSVVETYNGQYLAKDRAQREEASKSAYMLRDSVQAAIDELKGLSLSKDTAYAQDVEHLIQLATWMYNRVDVLCRSWDISLALPEGERPLDHQDEILRPLREVEMVNGRAIDVVEYEENVGAWKPVEK